MNDLRQPALRKADVGPRPNDRAPSATDDVDQPTAILRAMVGSRAPGDPSAGIGQAASASAAEARGDALDGAALATSPRREEILRFAVEEAARLVGAEGAILYVVDDATGDLRFAHAAGIADAATRGSFERLRLSARSGLFGLAIAEERAQVTGDYLQDARFQRNARADSIARGLGLRSVVVAPLIVTTEVAAGAAASPSVPAAHRPVGALGAFSSSPDRFGEPDVALVRALADHAAAAIANVELIEVIAASSARLARRAATEQALREIGTGITAIRDPGEVLQATVDAAVRLLRADGAVIDLLDPATGRLDWAYDAGLGGSPQREWLRTIELRPGVGVFGRAVADRAVFNTPDYAADERVAKGDAPNRVVAAFGIRSNMAAPLLSEGEPIGAIGVWARRPNAWDADDEATIGALAVQASIAMTNARLIEQLARSQRELAHRVETERALRAIASRITALTDLDDVLQPLVDDAKRLLGSDDAHLTLMADSRRYLVPVVVAGSTDPSIREWLQAQQFPLGGGINGLAAATNQAIWSEDYMVDPRVPHEADDQATAERLGLRAVAVVPLRAPEGSVLGTLAVSFRRPGAVTAAQLELLQALGDHAAIAIANSRLYARVRASEARYRYLVQSSPDIVFQMDAEGAFTYLSDTVEPVTGWRPDELLGRGWASIVAPEDLPLVDEHWAVTRVSPERTHHFRFTMLRRDGSRLPGELHGRGMAEEGAFTGAHGSVRDVSDQVRLERDLRQQAAALAAGAERGHLARELHDSVTQALFSMTLLTRSIELLLTRDPDDAMAKLANLRELQRDALAEMRSLIFELRPGSLADDGLVHALRTHAAAVQGRIGLPIVFTADDVERLPLDTEEALYRIAQEALHNVVKHAAAQQIRLTLARDLDAICLAVEDDGSGFDPSRVDESAHLGLAGMRARAEKIGARLEVRSRTGHGTRIEVAVPFIAPGSSAPAVAGQMT
jgi:PAS domain S-box-containing protein